MDDEAVNELIGTILLMAIAVGLVGAFILVLFSIPGPAPASHTDLQAFIDPTTPNELVLEHRGGPAIPIAELIASVTVNGTTTRYAVGDALGGTWSVRSASGASKAATESFALGDQAIFTSNTLYSASATVTVVDNDEAALTLGATVVASADSTAPSFAGSRTTSATTLTVNFTEALRAVAAGDFLVGGGAVTSIALLGDGSSAELTVPAFATDAMPAVTSKPTVSGTYDIAGNLFATSASSTPTDGVSPAILTGPSATPTSSAATITWTTGEAGTPIVRYGPTPSDLGLTSGVGALGTSHSLRLADLTDNFRYYYEVVTTDPAGSTVTSATGSFVTLASAGGGGSGDNDPVPYHYVFNASTAATPAGTVTPRTTNGVYRVALRNATDATVTATADIDVVLSTNSSAGYFLDVDGVTQVRTVTIPTGASFSEFRYIDHRDGGSSVLGATTSNIAPVFMSVQITTNTGRGIPFRLEFTAVPTGALTSGTVSSVDYVVTLRDVGGRAITPDQDLLVRLGTNSSFGLFLDPDGLTPITTRTLTTTNGTAWFKYVDRRTNGTSLLHATANGTLTGTALAPVTGRSSAGLADHVRWSVAPTTVASGVVAGPFTLQLRDAWNEQIQAPASTVLTLATNSTSARFCSDASCATPITSVTLATGAALSSDVYYVDHRFSAQSVLMASAPKVSPALHVIAVTGGTPPFDHLAWTTTDLSQPAGEIAGPYQLTLRDHAGLARTTPTAIEVTLATNSTHGVFCSASNCATLVTSTNVTAGGSTSSQFYYRDARGQSMAFLSATSPRVTGAGILVAVTGGSNLTAAAAVTTPYQLRFTQVHGSLDPGINSTAFIVELRDAAGSAVTPVGPLTVNVTTNSDEADVLNATTFLPQSSFTISTAQTTATFSYRDDRSRGGNAHLCAQADNVIGDCSDSRVNDRGLAARYGDSDSSVRVFLQYTADQDDNDQIRLGFAIANPTPTNKSVNLITFTASPALTASFFNTGITTVSGGDLNCSWSGVPTNNATCVLATPVVVPAFGARQMAVQFNTAAAGDEATVLTATAYLNTTSRKDEVNVRHEASNSDAQQIEFLALSASGGNKRGALMPATAAIAQEFWFRHEYFQDALTTRARIQIPAGWTDVTVPHQAAFGAGTGVTFAVQDPTPTQPGYVHMSSFSVDVEFAVRATPPATRSGLDVWFVELQVFESGQTMSTQANAFPVEVSR